MAVITRGPKGARGPAIKGRLIEYASRGRDIIAAWPRRRGQPASAITRDQVWKFRAANKLAKLLPGRAWQVAINATRGTYLYPRDHLLQTIYGRAFTVVLTDGRKLYPMSARIDTSELIDILAQLEGDLLTRGSDFWQGIRRGGPGQVLTDQGTGSLHAWAWPGAGAAARIEKTLAQAVGAGVTTVTWQVATLDPLGMADLPNNRLLVPAGVAAADITLTVGTGQVLGATREAAIIRLNGTVVAQQETNSGVGLRLTCSTLALPVAPGDVVDAQVYVGAGTRTLTGSGFCSLGFRAVA